MSDVDYSAKLVNISKDNRITLSSQYKAYKDAYLEITETCAILYPFIQSNTIIRKIYKDNRITLPKEVVSTSKTCLILNFSDRTLLLTAQDHFTYVWYINEYIKEYTTQFKLNNTTNQYLKSLNDPNLNLVIEIKERLIHRYKVLSGQGIESWKNKPSPKGLKNRTHRIFKLFS